MNQLLRFLVCGKKKQRGSSGPNTDEWNLGRVEASLDEEFYLRQVEGENLEGMSLAEHYYRLGWLRGLDPAPWFSTQDYIARYPDVANSGMNPFLHYLKYGRNEQRDPSGKPTYGELEGTDRDGKGLVVCDSLASGMSRTVILENEDLALVEAFLDPVFYAQQNPAVDFTTIAPAEHYLSVGWMSGLDPSPAFSTSGYLKFNPDVLKAGLNPLIHYLKTGRSEGRRWGVRLSRSDPGDLRSSWVGYDQVRQHGGGCGDRPQARLSGTAFCKSLHGCDLLATVLSLSFAATGHDSHAAPLVSIIIPCLDQELLTAECLASIAAALPLDFGIEVLIADNASTDPLYAGLHSHPGLRIMRFDRNIGFGPACNAAAATAEGKYLFFLNNDAQVAPGCLETLVTVMEDGADGPRVGLVGPKLLFLNGMLQEAGCLLGPDGTASLIGFGEDPRTARFNYRREVEHLSGAAVLLRRSLFEALGGFDPAYAPAYCEDADLSLKIAAQGLAVVYEPAAVVAHHMSATSDSLSSGNCGKAQRIAKNRDILLRRWDVRLTEKTMRTIAFYLPQYHTIPENDAWWGKGFTEWHNIGRAVPNYVGQYQPRLPADLGYYDLRLPDVMDRQIVLAKRYGISGFCYYYYWFQGKRLLEGPLEARLERDGFGFPFCLCWANENWTRRWDGRSDDILIGQQYTDDQALAVVEDFARYFQSKDYIRVNGRPLFLVYRIQELPTPHRWTDVWRNHCRRIGIGEICIAAVESFDLSATPQNPDIFGCDITVEFPPHGMVHDQPLEVERINPEWTGSVHDYRDLAAAYMQREEPGFKRIRSVLAGWDNTPRHQQRSLILENATPGAFQAWLEWTYRRTLEQNIGDERIVFINAWNEWCEGSYLEPDQRFGHDYLQAVRNALEILHRKGQSFVAL